MVLAGRLALLSLVLSFCHLVDELASDDPRVLNNFRLPAILSIYLCIIFVNLANIYGVCSIIINVLVF